MSDSSSGTTETCRPAARSASIRSATVARRSASSAEAATRANPSRRRSWRASPRHSPSALRKVSPAAAASRASSARPRATSLSKRSRSSSPGLTLSEYPPPLNSSRPSPRARRSRETCTSTPCAALAGGRSAQSMSTMRSRETDSFRSSRRIASSARCSRPARRTLSPARAASIGPRIRKSNAVTLSAECNTVRGSAMSAA